MAKRETEIAVERIDQDLEGLLKRFQVAAFAALEFAHGGLGLNAEASQVLEYFEEYSQPVGCTRMPALDHQRRVQRGDVAMGHVAREAASAHLCVAAAHFA